MPAVTLIDAGARRLLEAAQNVVNARDRQNTSFDELDQAIEALRQPVDAYKRLALPHCMIAGGCKHKCISVCGGAIIRPQSIVNLSEV